MQRDKNLKVASIKEESIKDWPSINWGGNETMTGKIKVIYLTDADWLTMAKPYEKLTDAQKKRLAMRRQALDDDNTDAFFEVQSAKPQPPEGWKEQGE